MKLFYVFIFSMVFACSTETTSDKNSYSTESAADDIGQLDVETNQNPDFAEQKIIKTAHITFEVSDLESKHKQVSDAIEKYKAYIQEDNAGKTYNRKFHRITIRVPTESFQPLLNEIGSDVDLFDEKTITREDVGEEFVDLEARLKAKRKLEQRYLDLLDKAKNVKEILEIERELSVIREEIEAKEGRLKYLQNQVSFSTIHLNFYKSIRETGITQSYGNKLINAIKGGWDGLSMFLLGIVYVWPFILLIIIGFFFFKRWKRRKKNTA